MTKSLVQLNSDCWQQLAKASQSPSSHYRYPSLSTVGLDGSAQSRIVVLRHVTPARRELVFYTDINSKKWPELRKNPRTSVLAYDATDRTQLRMNGRVALLGPEADLTRQYWRALPEHARRDYTGGPLGELDEADKTDPAVAKGDRGSNAFGVLLVTVNDLDWLKLAKEGNPQAKFTYGASGNVASAIWVKSA
ncbi:pyridoxamine 5'-phosphate oxidase [Roseovarius albus]|uniref:Pyridoxamine 5'-phosphate oxidase n=1 Tax=Roseovarius albus TaxID=1247867 RepID=A0A1X6ZUP3_9RHOB|nr:pyridoxamine 5'-phosphate oxidase family protein [Roseovarius albus]SLN62027.1 pyridoxamine 5'-phosphate oxidase [Roseovarius albus]